MAIHKTKRGTGWGRAKGWGGGVDEDGWVVGVQTAPWDQTSSTALPHPSFKRKAMLGVKLQALVYDILPSRNVPESGAQSVARSVR